MSEQNNIIAIIPARYDSERFPGKPLAKILGKPLIQWVYEATLDMVVSERIVATDDSRIFDCVTAFGGEAMMTSKHHATGADRIAEVTKHKKAELIINIQGDEPLISASNVNELIAKMLANPKAEIGTLAMPIERGSGDFEDPNVVKVVVDKDNYALYFSRAGIPFFRNPSHDSVSPLKHWGVYAYRKSALENFVSWPRGYLEKAESLEQLRALENNVKILVVPSSGHSIGIDVPDDIRKVEHILKEKNP